MHLRNAPTKLMKDLGASQDYRYAHDEAEAYAAGENYFPDEMKPVHYYEPVDRGLEKKIAERLRYLGQLDHVYHANRKQKD
jgi:putative ATPase